LQSGGANPRRSLRSGGGGRNKKDAQATLVPGEGDGADGHAGTVASTGARWWRVRPAEYFGEANLVFHNHSSGAMYTASADGRCKLLEFPKEAIVALLQSDPSLRAGLRIKVLRSACSLDDLTENKRARVALFDFLRRTCAEERVPDLSHGLRFHKAVVQYMQLERLEMRAASKAVAQTIFLGFLSDGSRRYVGYEMEGESRAELFKLINSDQRVGPLLEREATQLRERVLSEYLGRFFDNPVFFELLEELGSYDKDLSFNADAIDACFDYGERERSKHPLGSVQSIDPCWRRHEDPLSDDVLLHTSPATTRPGAAAEAAQAANGHPGRRRSVTSMLYKEDAGDEEEEADQGSLQDEEASFGKRTSFYEMDGSQAEFLADRPRQHRQASAEHELTA